MAAELVVLAAAAVKTVMAGIPARFETATGNEVRFAFGTAGAMRDKAISGEPFDVVIVPPALQADLVKRGLVAAGSSRDLVTVRLGAAVPAGIDPPAIGTVAEFKAALLTAPSVGMADPATGATSGIYLMKLLDTLGLAQAVIPKLHLYPEGQTAMEAGAHGEIALGLGQISEIMPVAGMNLIGPLPEALQLRTVYAASLAAHPTAPAAATQLLAMLEDAETAGVFRKNGFDL